jgi:polyisoprenoid-binding protein YceI
MSLLRAACLSALLLSTAAAAEPAAWTVDAAGSSLGFHGTLQGQRFDGTFRTWSAEIRFDPNDLAASKVTATIAPASAVTGDAGRDKAIPTADWFDVAKFPEARFVASELRAAGPERYVAVGELTIRGRPVRVELPFELKIDGASATMRGSTELDRGGFGVGQGGWAGGDMVGLKVGVDVKIKATRAP